MDPPSSGEVPSTSAGDKAGQASNTSLDAIADSYYISATNTPPQEQCPDIGTLVHTDQTDAPKLLRLAPNMIKELYTQPGYDEFTNLNANLAAEAGLHGAMVTTWCGATVAESTWVVKMTFPKNAPSASMSAGQFMVSKTRKGWQVWFRYH
jgi:hypothetical protein